MKEQIHVIDKRKVSNKELKQILLENKNIKFVSLMGVDLGGNATDEKIPKNEERIIYFKTITQSRVCKIMETGRKPH